MSTSSETAANLSGTFVVTGGNRGIGYSFSEALARAGSNVAIIYRSHPKAPKAAQELQEKFKDIKVQVHVSLFFLLISHGLEHNRPTNVMCDFDKLEETYANVEKDMGDITGVIANAGISIVKPASELNQDDFRKVFNVNVFGVFNTCHAAAKLWKETGRKGSIVITASMRTQIINRASSNMPLMQAVSDSSKAAVRTIGKTLAAEWAADNIRVNTISSEYVTTDQTKEMEQNILNGGVPLGPFAEGIASQVLSLLSDRGSYMFASDYVVDG